MAKDDIKQKDIEKLAEKIRMTIDLNELVAYHALKLWEDCPHDFCIQYQNETCIIFGSVNRVVWRAMTGFRIDKSYCTDSFIEHYEQYMGLMT